MSGLALLGIAEARGRPAARLAVSAHEADWEAILAHHRQVVALAEAGPFLPAPFGLAFASAREARQGIARHREVLAERLAAFGEGVEWLLRGAPEPLAEAAGNGREYLRARASRQARLLALRASAESLAPIFRAAGSPWQAIRPRADGGLDLVIWLDRGWSRARIEGLIAGATEAPGLWRLSGPWPAYAAAGLGPLFRRGRVSA